jgi:hypothetical protein
LWAGFLVLVLLPSVLLADTFLLRDGRRLEGTAEEDGDELIITTYHGKVVRVARKDIMGSTKEPARNAFYKRLRELKPGDAQACFALGEWAVEKKLTNEAKVAFERTLAMQPGHAGALKALKGHSSASRMPPLEGDLVIAPAARRPEKVERDEARALAQRLANLKQEDGAEKQALVALARERPELFTRVLKTPLRSDETQARLRAVYFMGWAGDRRAMDALLGACFDQPDGAVRQGAAKALGQLGEPVALRKLVDVAVTPKFPWPTRQRACAALRSYGDKGAIRRLLSQLSFELAGGNPRDPKNPMARSPAGLGSENPLGVREGNLPVGPVDDRVIYPVLSAVKEVTGMTFRTGEKDYRTWQQWWRENHQTFRFPP